MNIVLYCIIRTHYVGVDRFIDLDLVPVHLCTLGSSLLPFQPVHCGISTSSHVILTLPRSCWNLIIHINFGCPLLHLPPTGVHVIGLWLAGDLVSAVCVQSYGICAPLHYVDVDKSQHW